MPVPELTESRLLDDLPAIYRGRSPEDDPQGDTRFLGRFLLPFEKVLLGRADGVDLREEKNKALGPVRGAGRDQGLEEKIALLHTLFDARLTPAEFLPWLAGWAALALDPALTEAQARELIIRIVPLYAIRGTKAYLEELLRLYLRPAPVVVIEEPDLPPLQIGRHSTVERDTYLGGSPPHFFQVALEFPAGEGEAEHAGGQRWRLARRVIELAKPAHTTYDLRIASRPPREDDAGGGGGSGADDRAAMEDR